MIHLLLLCHLHFELVLVALAVLLSLVALVGPGAKGPHWTAAHGR